MKGQQMNLTETRIRSIVKGLVWRGLASMATFVLVWAFFREPLMALEVSLLEVIVKLLLYYGHERTWNIVGWGRIPATATSDSVNMNKTAVMAK
jgi:uncharacterized membrane protein